MWTFWEKFVVVVLVWWKQKVNLPKPLWKAEERREKNRVRTIQTHIKQSTDWRMCDMNIITSPMISFIQILKKKNLHFIVCCEQKPYSKLKGREKEGKTNSKQRGELTRQQSTTKKLMPSVLSFCITAVTHTQMHLSLQDTNNILMWFCPQMNRRWDVSLWDLIELQMTVGVDAATHSQPVHDLISGVHPLYAKRRMTFAGLLLWNAQFTSLRPDEHTPVMWYQIIVFL